MMRREASTLPAASRSLSRQGWRRSSRSVLVRVLDGALEVDAFQVSRAETLRDALRPIYRNLSRGKEAIQFLGLEEESLPLGIKRPLPAVTLSNLAEALIFLGS